MKLGLLLLLGCRPAAPPERWPLATRDHAEHRPAEVRFRPADPPELPLDGEGRSAPARLVGSVPRGQWDRGLAAAAESLLTLATDRSAALDPASTVAVAAAAGFPAPARFSRLLNGGAFPASLVDGILDDAGGLPVDLGLARRDYGDGLCLWVLAWSPHRVELDPMPRDLPLDGALSLHAEWERGGEGTVTLVPPDAPVEVLHLSSGVDRWLDRFQTPGEYRIGVVVDRGGGAEVALSFSVFVDVRPSPLPPLSPPPEEAPDPIAAEASLYAALNALRAAHGLAPVQPFPLFEPLAREHAALMGAAGRVAHSLPGMSQGVAARASQIAHPRAEFLENVAVAATAADAEALVRLSPPHLANLLCTDCTHAAIGAALEPVLTRTPRLFVTWELLRFPNGMPRPIDHYNR